MPSSRAKRSSLRRRCDRMWSQYINIRDVTCQMADGECEGRLEAAHIIGKQMGGARYATRWNPLNGVLLCQKHHREFDGVFDKFAFAEKRLGPEQWEDLRKQALERWDLSYDRVIANLKALLESAA